MRVIGITNVSTAGRYSYLTSDVRTKPIEHDSFVRSNPVFQASAKLNSNPAVFEQKRSRLLKQIESLLEEMPPDLTNREFLTTMFHKFFTVRS